MNRHTFKDVASSKRDSLAHDIDLDEDDDERITNFHGDVEGEEDDGNEKFNDIGEVMEPFNMKEEREGGDIDENMNYVFKKERVEEDAWLADMDEAAMEKGIGEAAAALRLKREKQLEKEKQEDDKKPLSVLEYKQELVRILLPGESISGALRRLCPPRNRTSKQKASGGAVVSTEESAKNKALADWLTDIADVLLGLSGGGGEHSSIYETTYEAVYNSMVAWEYVGRGQGDESVVFGPYTTAQVAEWIAQGFFVGANAVYMRTVYHREGSMSSGASATEHTSSSEELMADLDSDDEENASAALPSAAIITATADTRVVGEWVLSDGIDFQEYAALPCDASVVVQKAADMEHNGDGSAEADDDANTKKRNDYNDLDKYDDDDDDDMPEWYKKKNQIQDPTDLNTNANKSIGAQPQEVAPRTSLSAPRGRDSHPSDGPDANHGSKKLRFSDQ